MTKENEWSRQGFDLFHHIEFENSTLKISFNTIGDAKSPSTIIFIKNVNDKPVQIQFDWYKIPNRRKNKVYDIKPGQQKRFVVPFPRRLSVLYKSIQ